MVWLGETIPSSLNIFPEQFGFIGSTSEASLTLTNPGSDGSIVTATVQENEDWIAVTSDSVDSNGLGTYRVEIDSSKVLPNETKSGVLTVSYQIDGGVLQVEEVEVFASNPQQTDDTVGQLWVYLLRKQDVEGADNDTIVSVYAGVAGELSDGVYEFQLTNIPAGQYFLEASTNNDQDFFVFDEGEARGAYPLFSQLELITVEDQNIQGLNFDVQYQSHAQSSSAQSSDSNSRSVGRMLNLQNNDTSLNRKIGR